MNTSKEFELGKLLRFGLTYETISNYDIICFPENIESVNIISDLFDVPDAIILSKLLKNAGLNCANSFDLNLEPQILERRSNEKWFGTIYLKNKFAVPIFVTVLGGLLTTELNDIIKSKEQPIPNVHIKLKIEKPNNISTIDYSGDAKTLITILKNLDLEDKK